MGINILIFLVVVLIFIVICAKVGMTFSVCPLGQAMIVFDEETSPKVVFGGILFDLGETRHDFVNLATTLITSEYFGFQGLLTKDNIRLDIRANYYVSINQNADDVLLAAKTLGAAATFDPAAVRNLFAAKFGEALAHVVRQFDCRQLIDDRRLIGEYLAEAVKNDMHGFVLEGAAVDYLNPTPKSGLDSTNDFDAEGQAKVKAIADPLKEAAAEEERQMNLAIEARNLEARQASLALELEQAQAEAKARLEIEALKNQNRPAAEIEKVANEFERFISGGQNVLEKKSDE